MAKHFTLPYEGGLIDKNLPAGILHTYEKIWTHVYPESRPASYAIADFIVNAINTHEGGLYRLGLSTGSTPTSLYNELARRYRDGKVSFKNVEVVSIDEYYPIAKEAAQSRNHRLHEALLDKVDIRKENIHIPDGTLSEEETGPYCIQFDAKARNLDLLVMGVGEQGQVGFNEAGSNEKTRTRVVRLSYASRKRQAGNFNNDISATPDKAITLGVGTMLSAKRIILMAWGEDKANAVKAISEGPATADCPASLLQRPHLLLRRRSGRQPAHQQRGALAGRSLRLDAQVHPQSRGLAVRSNGKTHPETHRKRLPEQQPGRTPGESGLV